MKLKNIIPSILVIIITVAITIGITVAYLTDTESVDNKMTVANVDVELREYERVSVGAPNEKEETQVQKFNNNKPLSPLLPLRTLTITRRARSSNGMRTRPKTQ